METEAKFTVSDEATFAHLRTVDQFGPYQKRDERTKEITDRYLDTSRFNFLNKGWALRLRQGKEGDLLITIKGLERHPLDDGAESGGIHAREEYETSAPGITIGRWPASEARRLARSIAGHLPLRDLVSVDQVRNVSRLYDGERAVAELSLDHVTFHRSKDQVEADTTYELEAELLPDGTVVDLRALSHIFTEEYGLEPQLYSKFEQALLIAGITPDMTDPATQVATPRRRTRQPRAATQEPAPPSLEAPAPPPPAPPEPPAKPSNSDPKSRIQSTDSMALAGRKLIAQHYEAMLSNEEGSRLGEDPEAVHDMRVATRRMRAAMRVFGPHLQSKRAREVASGLRDIAHALGEVRDLDVLIGNVETFRESLPQERQPGLHGMLEEWRVKRWKARKALLRLLNSKEYRLFKREMDRFLNEKIGPPNDTEGAQPYQVRHLIGSTIISHYESVRSFEALPGEPTILQLHALRIAGKYFRYTLEFFRDVLPKDVTAMIRDVTKLQDNLGELHDADVAHALVEDYAKEQTKHRDHKTSDEAQSSTETTPPGLAAYLDDLHSTMDRKRKEYVTTWANLHSPEWRKRLAALLVT